MLRDLAAGAVVLAALALAYAWAHTIDPFVIPEEPATLELLAVRIDALRFLIGLVACLCGLALAVLRCPRFGLVAVLVTAWAWIPVFASLRAERPAGTGTASLRVLSVNLAVARAESARVLEVVRAADPDLVFFQEYTPKRADELRPRLTARYATHHERPRTDAFGMAVYARVPLQSVESFHLGDSRTPQIRLEAMVGGEAIAVYGIHLVPIAGPLYVRHRREFVDLVDRLQRESRATALVGDFNFVPHGALAEALRERGFLPAHALAGAGRGATWPVQLMDVGIPGVRIDHVFAGRGLTCTAAWVGAPTGSDHLPVCAVLAPSPE